jgi:fission process protein 1
MSYIAFDLHRILTACFITAWGPTLTGLAVVPILPYLFDHPVETATEAAFKWIEEKVRESSLREGKPPIPPKKEL